MSKTELNIELLKTLNIPAYEQSKNVFRVDTPQGAVMYYPPGSKWQHRGRTYTGDVQSFRGWLKKHHFLGGQVPSK